jgi:tetratricopeptide (TPR) repeat protein
MWEKSLGPSHPDVGRGLSNLADCFHQQGKLNGAVTLYRRAQEILRENLGDGHEEVRRVVRSLAQVYSSQGRYTESEKVRASFLPN